MIAGRLAEFKLRARRPRMVDEFAAALSGVVPDAMGGSPSAGR